MKPKIYIISLVITFLGLFIVSISAMAQVQEIFILKEIDDDNIIIITKDGDKLLLEKWTMRFSPLLFEGKTFYASISPMWVTIYFDDRDPIKWSIEENLGNVDSSPQKSSKVEPKTQKQSVYAGVGSGHWIQKVIDSGKMILLEDGSLWEISAIDVITSMLWLPITEITVLEGDGVFPYKLINTDDGEIVEAKLIGQK